ncbi:MAG: beta-lactamase family protein [Bacteroidia bacterium]|nr:beta-lactamase family protein [Bacteroidia bacterium]NND52770.1 serine hydrolase [Flavobacteriaceae bacterium]
MKSLKKLFKWLVILIGLLVITLYVFDCDYMLKALRTIYLQGHTTAFLEDYKEFDNSTIEAGQGQAWAVHKDYNTTSETQTLLDWNEKLGTVAFLIIKNDSIWFENYYDGYDKNSKSNSFSMAKSMISAMLGKAIMQGKIKGLDQPVSDFFSEFSDGKAAQLTVGDLSSMASGMNWDESYYSPFSITTRAYFYDDLESMMLGVKVVDDPGTSYKYLSGNTQLLGMVIEKATGESLSDYLSKSFWKPLGAENEAFWQIDSEDNKLEKAYCCVASNARDFARFGKLYKDHGKWRGQSVLDSGFVAKSVRPRFIDSPQYGFGWWLLNYDNKNFFMMRGHLGQYVIIEPNDNVIIVRLGHKSDKAADPFATFSADIYAYIDEAYKMMN